jgi:hypothetical protein
MNDLQMMVTFDLTCHICSSSLKSGNVSSVTYGSTVGLGSSADLNYSPSLSLDSSIWPFVGTIYVVLTALI